MYTVLTIVIVLIITIKKIGRRCSPSGNKTGKSRKHTTCLQQKIPTLVVQGCISLRKSKIGFKNPKESKTGFCVSLLNRSIQDLWDRHHGASKEPMNPV